MEAILKRIGRAEMWLGTKFPGNLTTDGRDTSSMEKGKEQISDQVPQEQKLAVER